MPTALIYLGVDDAAALPAGLIEQLSALGCRDADVSEASFEADNAGG